ncbi:unnamed protein product [Lactuca virosa]|uniref:Exocyst component Exo84 C-terminal domain-containing protein n=1 Tax=Lactuca virosa TaxID=75947 RepID=A0AAU9ME89_9ASTR|nr:unnamed protein product [Lactuca virosa]
METSPPASKFRFRDHGDDMENGESVVDDTSSEPSSVTSDEDSDIESDELASMTAKGINHLCLELIELRQASEVDFQDNIISNYLSFIRVFRETKGINNEVMQLKYHLMSQKQLVQNLMDGAYLKAVSDDPMDTVVEEHPLDDQNPTTFFKTCADEVLETLDNLLFEHRLEEALGIFEIEDGNSPKVKLQEDVSPDVWMCYKSDMAERRVKLADKLTLVADNTRISAAELQKSLVGLSSLGFDHLATRLLFKYYHTRIASGVNNLQSSARFLPGIHIHDLAKYIFSMMYQAARSFVMLHGETSTYDSELMKWACEETEAFASCFNTHVRLISQTGDGLSMVVNSLHSAMSYCSVLESQKLVLQPCLIEHILPCIQGFLKTRFDHFKKVISIFTSNDVWVMGRYLVSGMLTEDASSLAEYCLLTNSGRKFMSLLQTAIEDASSLVSILGSSILEELMNLFTEYAFLLQTALTHETNHVVEGAPRIQKAESLSQKVSIFANLSTLEQFFFIVIRNLFKNANDLKIVIESHMESVAGTFSRLRTEFCKQFIHDIMSNEASCIREHSDIKLLQDLMPSLPYQILFLELRKVEELAEENVVEFDWLVMLLKELIETIFDWISRNHEIWMTNKEDTTVDQSDRLTQFAVDMQFVVEIARRGGYLTTNMMNSSKDVVLEMESAMVSGGFDINRYVVDYEKVAKSAMEAIKELEAVEEEKWKSDEGSEEHQSYFSSDSIEDDDNDDDNEMFKEVYLEPQPTEMSDDVCVEEEEGVGVVNVEIKEVVSLTTSDELLQLRKIRRVSKVVLQNQE